MTPARPDHTRIAPSPHRASRARAPRGEFDGAVRDGEPEGRPDGAFHQADLAAVGAHQLGGDGETETGAAGAGRALEGLEQMLAGALRKPRAGVGDLDHHHRALAPSGYADLITPGILLVVLRVAALERGKRVARKVEQDAKQVFGVGIHGEAALDRIDTAHARS